MNLIQGYNSSSSNCNLQEIHLLNLLTPQIQINESNLSLKIEASEVSNNNSDNDVHCESAEADPTTALYCQIETDKVRKQKRNSGQAYRTKSGKLIEERAMIRLEHCRNKCREKISYEDQNHIFTSYWNMGTYNERFNYILKQITLKPKKRLRIRSGNRTRQYTVYYSLNVKSQQITVCQKCFLNTLGETRGFIYNVVKKCASKMDKCTAADNRGKRIPKIKSPPEKNTAKNVLRNLKISKNLIQGDSALLRSINTSQETDLPNLKTSQNHINRRDRLSEIEAREVSNSHSDHDMHYERVETEIDLPNSESSQTHMNESDKSSNTGTREVLNINNNHDHIHCERTEAEVDVPTFKTPQNHINECYPSSEIKETKVYNSNSNGNDMHCKSSETGSSTALHCKVEPDKVRKQKRNSGQAYRTKSGKLIEERAMKRLEHCRNKCREKLSYEDQNRIFTSYWSMGTYSERFIYILNQICLKPKERLRIRSGNRPRQYSVNYFLNVESEQIKVCKTCFLNTLGETNGFIYNVVKKCADNKDKCTASDKRGKHVPKAKSPPEKITEIENHIAKFSTYESHYSCSHGSQKYLPAGLNVKTMHQLYCNETKSPLSLKVYRRVFKASGLKFESQLDTCSKCDECDVRLKHELDKDCKKMQ